MGEERIGRLENSKNRAFPLCCGTGALTGYFYFHRLWVSRWLMVRCPEVFAFLLGSPSASSALFFLGFRTGTRSRAGRF